MTQENLSQSFLNVGIDEDLVIKAEDAQRGGGINFSEIFFEPDYDKAYKIKFVPNLFGKSLVSRDVYKSLPDPDRRGKHFQYTAAPSPANDPVRNLFFKLFDLKKSGNPIAEQKITNFLKATKQGCSVIQILESKDDENYKAGDFRLFVFSNFGDNATIANLIKTKYDPDEDLRQLGTKPENIWDVFGSSVMYIKPTKAKFPDGKEGRSFTKCTWLDVVQGVSVPLEDGTLRPLTKADVEIKEVETNGKKVQQAVPKPEIVPLLQRLQEVLSDDKLSIHNWFAHKVPGDKLNTEDTEEHLKRVLDKVGRILPIIDSANSIQEVLDKCSIDNSAHQEAAQTNNVIAESIPADLKGSIVDGGSPVEQAIQATQSTTSPTTDSSNSEADAILSGNAPI